MGGAYLEFAWVRKCANSSGPLGGAGEGKGRRGATQVNQNTTQPTAVKVASTKSRKAFSHSIAGPPSMAVARMRSANQLQLRQVSI